MSVTSCFYNLLKETVGVVPRDGSGKVDPAAAKLRSLDSTILDAAYSAVPEVRHRLVGGVRPHGLCRCLQGLPRGGVCGVCACACACGGWRFCAACT
jgi:hypothetical protein